MKYLKLVVSSLFVALAAPVFAQSATKDVTVDATLTSACRFTSGTGINLTATYPAFSSSSVAPSSTVTVECTRGGGTPAINFQGGTIGTVAGLVFQLSAPFTTGLPGIAPLGLTTTDIGTPRTGQFDVTASFPAGQAGTTGTTSPVTKQMNIVF